MRGTQYIPQRVTEVVGRVFDFGARKHAPRGWLTIANYRVHFLAKMGRHATAYVGGQALDPESGEPHLAHLIADAMMLLDRDLLAVERAEDDTREVAP